MSDSSKPGDSRQLHREFVGMLFALAIAAAAERASVLTFSQTKVIDLVPSYLHLLLAALVITTSWVGWTRSTSSFTDNLDVFKLSFIELLMDLWLVVLYFFLVRSVQIPIEDTLAPGTLSVVPSSLSSEVLWIMYIFISYALWDIIAKSKKGFNVYIQRGWASIWCALLSIGIYLACYGSFEKSNVAICKVIFVNMALFSLVFLFRFMKREDFKDHSVERKFAIIVISILIILVPLLSVS